MAVNLDLGHSCRYFTPDPAFGLISGRVVFSSTVGLGCDLTTPFSLNQNHAYCGIRPDRSSIMMDHRSKTRLGSVDPI